jgi:hypothetical protein
VVISQPYPTNSGNNQRSNLVDLVSYTGYTQPVWNISLGRPGYPSNSFVGAGAIYVLSESSLLSINLQDGSQNWAFTRSGNPFGPLLLLPNERSIVGFGNTVYVVSSTGSESAFFSCTGNCGGAVLVGTVVVLVNWQLTEPYNAIIMAYSSTDFQLVWQQTIPQSAGCSPSDTLLLSSADNIELYVHCSAIGTRILAQTGSIKATVVYQERMRQRMILTRDGRYGYLQTSNSDLVKIDLDTASLLWQRNIHSPVALSPDESTIYAAQERDDRLFVDGLSHLNGDKVFTSHLCSKYDPWKYFVTLGRNGVLALGSQCGIRVSTEQLLWRGDLPDLNLNDQPMGISLAVDAQGNLYGAMQRTTGDVNLFRF